MRRTFRAFLWFIKGILLAIALAALLLRIWSHRHPGTLTIFRYAPNGSSEVVAMGLHIGWDGAQIGVTNFQYSVSALERSFDRLLPTYGTTWHFEVEREMHPSLDSHPTYSWGPFHHGTFSYKEPFGNWYELRSYFFPIWLLASLTAA